MPVSWLHIEKPVTSNMIISEAQEIVSNALGQS